MSALPISSAPSFYVVGGTMRPDAQSYVHRVSDEQLYAGLMENEFCHVLTARQMGKSSLMLRTAARLRKAGIGVAALDLTGIGTNLSPEQWYSGLIVQLGDRLNLEDELLRFWQANVSLGPMQRWVSAIRKVVLPLRAGRLAIFIDEIDAVASLKFSTDEFFSGIRECYNLRNEDAEMNRLTFCLLGVVNPSELIRDTRTTPFNVGRRIELNDFTEQEALPLAEGLGRSETENYALLKRVFYWTNGHPYLTQRLCKAVSENGTHSSIREIDESIERMFFSKRAQEYDDNLIFVRERLLRSGADVTALLNLYARVRKNKPVAADDSQSLASILRLSGITHAENGRLRVRNRIYERVFNHDWIKANLPGAELRRQRAAVRRGVLRTTGVAMVILAIVAALAITAFRQATINKQLLYMARMKVASQEYENANIARVEELVNQTTQDDLRGFEWFLFWQLAHNETLRMRDSGHTPGAKFFNGTDTVALAKVIHIMSQQRREYRIKLYDLKSQTETMSFSVPSGTSWDIATFSPDNKYVATDSPDNSVTVWELSSKSQIRKFSGPGEGVYSLAFAQDQQSLAATFYKGTFRVWDLNSSTPKFEGVSQNPFPGIALSPDGKHLAVAMSRDTIEFFDVGTKESRRSFSIPKGPVGRIFFSPDESKLFTTNDDGNIYGWNLYDGQLLNFNNSHSSEVMSFSFSPDGKTLATGSVDRRVKLWDVATGTNLRTILGHGGWITALDWSADGRYLLSGDNDGLIKIWDMNVKELPIWPDQKPSSVAATGFTPGNELIAVGRAPDGNLKLWNLSQGKLLSDLGAGEQVASAAFSKDAALVAVTVEPQVRIYSVATGKLISTLERRAENLYSLEFSPDGTKLLSGDKQGEVIISDVSSGRSEAQLKGENMYYRAVFSLDGKKIASADQDGKIKIWDVASRSIERTLTGHNGVVGLLTFSPDGRLLASAAQDNTVRLWDPATGKQLKQHIGSDSVQRFAFAPDGKRLVTVSLDGAVVLWDPNTMDEVVTIRKSGRSVTPSSVTFSPDGLTLAVSDEYGVKVWQAAQPPRNKD
ncbi:MAG TPA: AAA-like domain-containing protein [Pyrinomonadaceae bacterium]|nr:AAA-like domain-containing protein [Pyrinomonadaceae bacterium]